MAKATPKKFAMQQCFEILLRRPSDKKILAYLTDCKTSSLENTVEMVYPTGGAGNVYIGTGFGHSRRSTLTVESATFNTEVMAIQNGTEIATGSHELTAYDVLEVGADATENGVKTKHTAIGTANAEIGYVYLLNADGTYGKTLEQAAAAASGKFKYDSSTKTLTFFAGDVATGDQIACAYTYKTGTTAQKITMSADAIPATVLVSAYGVARDVCSGESFPCVIEGQAQMDGDWNFDLQADGDPVTQNLTMEFVRSCQSNKMYDFIIYTDEEDGE